MTSARLELEQLAYGVAWPVRALAAVSHAVDPLLRSSTTRRLAKAAVDFCCAVGAVVGAVAVGEGVRRFGPGNTATLAVLVGVLVVGADTLGGGYRTIWRYTSLKEAMAVGFSSLVVLGLLLAGRGIERFVLGGDLHRPGSTTLRELLDSAPPVPPKYQGGADGVRRVLVTGGAGFIGSHLTRMLLERGYHVRVLDRFDYGRAGIEGVQDPRLEVVQGDICSSRDVSRALRDVHGVLALAAIVGDPACNLDPEETINLNYTATK